MPRRDRSLPSPRSHSLNRDTDTTAFTPILDDLVRRIPGANGAALVDALGECVDYTGRAAPFDIKVAAAHWRILLTEAAAIEPVGPLRWLIVRAARKSFVAHALPDQYAIIVLLGRRAGFSLSSRAFAACERALYSEANWGRPRGEPEWVPIDVECDRRGRPLRLRIGEVSHPVEVIGAVVGLPPPDRGFRVRIDTGVEATLVREAGGFWYADELPPG